MNIFYAVQVSNFTNTIDGPKWILRNDACTNIMKGIVSTILDVREDYKFLIKLPPPQDTTDINSSLYELFDGKYHPRIEFIEQSIPISPITSRFHFDFEELSNLSNRFVDVDVMINDENTLTKNWKVLFKTLGLGIPIVSTNYFMDSPISQKIDDIQIRYYERQMESLISSDMFSYPVQSALDEAFQAYDYLFKDTSLIEGKSTVWHVGAHYGEIKSKQKDVNDSNDVPIIYFGNRITETSNRYTNWHIFADAIGILSQENVKDFRAIMLNPTKKLSQKTIEEIRIRSKGKIEIIGNDTPFSREDYIQFINDADITCNLFTNEVHGGLTHIEGMMAQNILIAPGVNDYKYKFENEGIDYPFLVESTSKEINITDFVSKLELAINEYDTENGKYWKQKCRDIAIKYESFERSSHKIIEDLEKLKTL